MASFDEGDIGRDCDAPVVVRGSVVARGAQVRGPVVRGRVVASHERLDEARTLQMYGVGAGAVIQALTTERDAKVALREEREAEERARTEAERKFGWKANYGMLVSKAEGKRRRRKAMEQARQRAQREAEAAQRKAEAEAWRQAEAEARRQARARQLEVAAKTRAELEAKFPGLKAQYEAARANGAPGDAEYDRMTAIAPPPDRAALHRAYQAKVPDSARARALLHRVRRGERAARARDSDARPPPRPSGRRRPTRRSPRRRQTARLRTSGGTSAWVSTLTGRTRTTLGCRRSLPR